MARAGLQNRRPVQDAVFTSGPGWQVQKGLSDRPLKPKKSSGKGITGMLIEKRFSRCVKEITFFYKHPFFSYKHSCT
jgi:hypothetical protein